MEDECMIKVEIRLYKDSRMTVSVDASHSVNEMAESTLAYGLMERAKYIMLADSEKKQD